MFRFHQLQLLFLSLSPSQLRSPFSCFDGFGVDVFAAGLLLDADARRGPSSSGALLSRRHCTWRSTTSGRGRSDLQLRPPLRDRCSWAAVAAAAAAPRHSCCCCCSRPRGGGEHTRTRESERERRGKKVEVNGGCSTVVEVLTHYLKI